MTHTATARACANIALVKYWGKRDLALNLPAAGSLSLTLEGLDTRTTVSFGAPRDSLVLDGQPAGPAGLRKALRVVDLVRRRAGLDAPVAIDSQNNFPTGAGLASSASGMAALALAAAGAAGLSLSPQELSALARVGSGSACRSIFGGFAEWLPGAAADGSDSHGVALFEPDHWDLRVLVAVVEEGPKPVDSTSGMLRTARTSPFHQPFLDSVPGDLQAARRAIARRDLAGLARVAEHNCLRMHAAMMAAEPPLIYLQPQSLELVAEVRRLQGRGLPVFFTIDAGPNVKLFCEPAAAGEARAALQKLPGVRRVISARPGPGARLVQT